MEERPATNLLTVRIAATKNSIEKEEMGALLSWSKLLALLFFVLLLLLQLLLLSSSFVLRLLNLIGYLVFVFCAHKNSEGNQKKRKEILHYVTHVNKPHPYHYR